MEMSENIDKLAPALLAAQMEMGNAVKDAKNPFFKSKYADLNAIREATYPVLNKHNVFVSQPTVVLNGINYVKTMLVHTSGQYIYALTQIKSLKENDPQAEGSGISYARRYGLQAITGIGAEDDDGEKSMGRGTTTALPKEDKPKTVKSSFRDGVSSSSKAAVAEVDDGWN